MVGKKVKFVPKFDDVILDQPDYQLATRAPGLQFATDPRLLIFGGRKVNVDYESSSVIEIKPMALQNELKFRMNCDQDLLLDPSQIFLKMKVRIMQIDDNGIAVAIPAPKRLRKIVETERHVEVESPPDKAGGNKKIVTRKEKIDKETEILEGLGPTPAPCFPLTMFKNVKVKLGANACVLEDTCKDLYHFQVFIRTLLEVNKDAIENQLVQGLFIFDSNEEISPFLGNSGLSETYIRSAAGKYFTLFSPLIVDGLHNIHEHRLYPPGFPFSLEFEKNPVGISMTCNEPNAKLTVDIMEMTLLARYYKLTAQTAKHFQQNIGRNVGFYSYSAP